MADQEKELFREIEDKYDYSYDELSPRFEKFNVWEDLYFSNLRNSDNPWKSSVFDPESYEKVERVVSHLFATKPRGKFYPREKHDAAGVRVADELFKYQWEKPGQNMQLKLPRQGRGMGIFGSGFGLLTWRYERRKRRKPNKAGEKTEQYEVIWDDPYYQDLYIYDCFPDPTAMSIEDMQWFIHNEFVTLEELENTNHKYHGERRYKNLDKLKEKLSKRKGNYSASQDSYRTKADSARGSNKDTDLRGRILVRRYYDKSQWVTIVPDFKLVIEDRPCPYDHGELPIHMMLDVVYSNQLFGVGEIEPIERLQKGLNAVLNQRLDNVRMQLSPAVMHDANSEYAHEWKWQPGYKWRLGANEKEPKPFQLPDATSGTFMQTANYFKDSMSRALGHQDFLSRNESADTRTATEIRASSGEQNARMRSKEHNIDMFMERLGTQWMQLNQQYMTKGRLVRILGREALEALQNDESLKEREAIMSPDGEEAMAIKPKRSIYAGEEVDKFKMEKGGAFGLLLVEPDDIRGAMDFIVESGSTVESDVTQQQADLESILKTLLDLKDQFGQEGYKVNIKPIIDKILLLRNIKNVDEIFEVINDNPMAQDPGQAMGGAPVDPMAAMMPQGGMPPQGGAPMMPPMAPQGMPMMPQGMPPQMPPMF
jgi:hypothetical protein